MLLLWLCREHNICHSRKTVITMPYYYYGCVGNITYVHSRKTAELMFERQFLITTNVLHLKF